MKGKKEYEIEIIIPKTLWNVLKYITVIFILLLVGGIILSFVHYWIPIYEKKECLNEGKIWCNGKCYPSCPTGQIFNCPQTGEPSCITTYNIQEMKKSIVYIRHDVTGCCDSLGQISSKLGGSGSGVIYFREGTTVRVLTSRHVVDCVFAGTCVYPQSEKITIRTHNGKFYEPTGIFYEPHNLDLAMLEFQTYDTDISPITLNSGGYSIGSKVIAIGYPAFGVESLEPVLEFSISEGNITNVHNLLTYQGFSFIGIESDAITGKGASGGGLFNQDGQLIGIITWGDREQKITIAIDTKVLSDIIVFFSCPSGSYPLLGEGCCPYGTIGGTDGKCYEPCGKPDSYCPSPNICCDNYCYPPCPSGYVHGDDCLCYPKCGDSYCHIGYECCNNQCIRCPLGYYLGIDCVCHSYFP